MKNTVVNKVYLSNDLSIFRYLKGNRPPNPQHIMRLTLSIEEYGLLQNPIIVNERMEVIDGQHRLLAAKKAGSGIYYIIVENYKLKEVQVLNLNQKNWTRLDFMHGYADMNIEPYVKLREFVKNNSDYNLRDCIAMCSNLTVGSGFGVTSKYRKDRGMKISNVEQVFEEGTWRGRDFSLGQLNAQKIRLIKPYYEGYRRSSFVAAMLGMFRNQNFDFNQFISKLKGKRGKLYDCASVSQYKELIEEIYNYRRRDKVNLRF